MDSQAYRLYARSKIGRHDVMTEATESAVDVDQDWENESTKFTFADGSVIRFCGAWVEILEGATKD